MSEPDCPVCATHLIDLACPGCGREWEARPAVDIIAQTLASARSRQPVSTPPWVGCGWGGPGRAPAAIVRRWATGGRLPGAA